MRRILTTLLAAVTVLFLSASSASAYSISYTGSLTGTSPQLEAYKGTITLNQFDPDLGTLNKVTITLGNVLNWTMRAENMSASSGSTITASINEGLRIVKSGSDLLTQNATHNGSWTIGVSDGMIDWGGTSGFTAPFTDTKSTIIEITESGLLAYIGLGTIAFEIYTSSQYSGGYSGGSSILYSSQGFSANALVEYDYSGVPIPGAVWLFGSGLIGLVGLRKKFRKN